MKKVLKSIIYVLMLSILLTMVTACNNAISLEVKFDSNGGSSVQSITTMSGKTITMPDDPTREGYNFDGWFWDNGVWDKPFTANSLLEAPLSKSFTVYAKWTKSGEAEKLTITFDTKGGSLIDPVKVDSGALIVEPTAPTKAGFTFNGWYADSECLTSWNFATKTVTADTMLYAGWLDDSVTRYTITYKDGAETLVAKLVVENALAENITPTKVGFNFLGWQLETADFDFTTPITADLVLTAKWEVAKIDIIFMADDVQVKKITINYNESITIPQIPAVPQKTGYDGVWNITEFNGITAPMTVTAVYTLKTYTATLNYNGATGGNSTTTKTLTYNQAIGELPTPTKTGYIFEGWTYDNATINKDTVWTTDNQADITFVAKWSKDPTSLTGVDIVVEGFTVDGDNLSIKVSNATLKFEFKNIVKVAEGSTWVVSNDDLGQSTIITKAINLEPGDNSCFIIVADSNDNVKAYAVTVRRRPMLAVNFVVDGQTITSQTIEEDSFAAMPETPTKTGYTFKDWGCDLATTPITPQNTTFNGVWTPNSFTITFDGNGADSDSSMSNQSFKCAEAQAINANSFTKLYYEFTGWTYEGKTYMDGQSINNILLSSNNATITFTANWKFVFKYTTFTIGSEEKLMITGMDGKSSNAEFDLIIPNEINGIKVDYLVKGFLKDKTYTSISMPCCFGEYVSSTNNEAHCFDDLEPSLLLAKVKFTSADNNTIRRGIFENCSGIKSIIISDSVTSIGDYAFDDCSGLTEIIVDENNANFSNDTNGILYDKEKTQIIYVPNGITGEIVLPNSLTSIEAYVFNDCSSLTRIIVDKNNANFSNDTNGILYNKATTQIVYVPRGITGEIILPNSLTSIRDYAFSDCRKLTSITISSGVTSIGSSAFENCIGLTSLTITNGVTSIGSSAFQYCSGLKDITLPTGLKTIGEYAFYNCSGLTSITIPSGVTSIGYFAFYNCSGLTSITIPSGVTSIGDDVFSGCSGLTSVTLQTGLTSIGDKAFKNCSGLTSTTIPDSVTSIGNDAFSGCSGLTSITISSGVRSIGNDAFSGCSGLTSITIPSGVRSIGKAAFSGCSGLTEIIVDENNANFSNDTNGILYDKEKTQIIYIPRGIIGEVVLPTGLTSIGDGAFSGCIGLTGITIPEKVTSIGEYAFYNCSKLTSITIPNTIKYIGRYAFSDCSGLTEITLPAIFTEFYELFGYDATYVPTSLTTVVINGGTSIKKNAFYYCRGLTSITIPSSVTSIEKDAFYYCSGLTSITLPAVFTDLDGLFGNYADAVPTSLTTVVINGGTSIGNWTFGGWSGITGITISDSVTSIGDNAFLGCSGLTEIILPTGLKTIGNSAFYNCSGLTSITIPDGVTIIENFMFENCSGLTSITIPSGVTSIGAYAFENCSSLKNIELPAVFTNFYELFGNKATAVPKSLTAVVINGGTSIGNNAFSGCSSLESIELPAIFTTFYMLFGDSEIDIPKSLTTVVINGGTSIGNSAFRYCSGLTSITLPAGITSIGEYAFSGCIGLTSITIPDSVTSIGYEAFCGCSSLTSITLPTGLTSIGDYAFKKCNSLESIELPAIFTTFYMLFGDSEIDIPKSLTTVAINGGTGIGDGVFKKCRGLTSITLPTGLTSIGEYAFSYCSGLTSITLPTGLTSIGEYAFSYCSGLTSITLPTSGLTSIGANAFPGCSKLTDITLPTGLTSIGYSAFYNCSKLTSITIPSGVTIIENSVFGNCSGLTSITIPSGVTSIGAYAFENCSGLASIVIPNTVTSIGKYAFENCSRLTDITLPTGLTNIGEDAFSGCVAALQEKNECLYLNNWLIKAMDFNITTVDIKVGTLVICDNAFKNCSKLTDITIPNTVTNIGAYAFDGCSGLTSIIIPSSVTSIGNFAFYGCNSLALQEQNNCLYLNNWLIKVKDLNVTTIAVATGTLGIYSEAFKGCSSLTSVTISDSVTSIGYGAFIGCSGLTSINIPDSVKSIGSAAFGDCSSLTSITIPSGVTSIEEGAFRDCSKLTNITISSDVTSIGNFAFDGCSGLIIYCEATSKPTGWAVNWNKSNRPVVWGCTLASEKSYVVSFTKTANSILNPDGCTISAPYRGGYTFGGWFTNAEFTGTSYTTDFSAVTDGTVLYAKWTKN